VALGVVDIAFFEGVVDLVLALSKRGREAGRPDGTAIDSVDVGSLDEMRAAIEAGHVKIHVWGAGFCVGEYGPQLELFPRESSGHD
jgi:hypothetical protein